MKYEMEKLAAPRRDQQKQARKDAIIAAAEKLIRLRGDVTFSMLDLSREAGLSPATPYNLFGTKSAILYALLNRSADRIFAVADAGISPAAHPAVEAAEALGRVLAEDPDFYRPLYAFLMGVADPAQRPAFMARTREYWLAPFRGGPQLEVAIEPEILADLMVTQALGRVEMWVHGELDNVALTVELRRSCSATLLGLVSEQHRAGLMEFIRAPRSHVSIRSGRLAQPISSGEKKRRASA